MKTNILCFLLTVGFYGINFFSPTIQNSKNGSSKNDKTLDQPLIPSHQSPAKTASTGIVKTGRGENRLIPSPHRHCDNLSLYLLHLPRP